MRHAHVTILAALLLLAFGAVLLHPYLHDPGPTDGADCRICLALPGSKPAPAPAALAAPTPQLLILARVAERPRGDVVRVVTSTRARDPPHGA